MDGQQEGALLQHFVHHWQSTPHQVQADQEEGDARLPAHGSRDQRGPQPVVRGQPEPPLPHRHPEGGTGSPDWSDDPTGEEVAGQQEESSQQHQEADPQLFHPEVPRVQPARGDGQPQQGVPEDVQEEAAG